ncbi:hypothetical protein [Nostoc sp. ChiQUE01b]|uniref:hypothetical protein n=1 Tax=Nostoc sp. ChiQUE01b TaxID=3075376 RepID=UPI002AD520EF|nr:hypothetical protein [Nostoc sp. ChiQUE01b]MDZ8263963.1 hypothetical protein [Nostoc sp. ChiQUE01b]
MADSNDINTIIDRIARGTHTETDIETLRQILSAGDRQLVTQLGKYNISIRPIRNINTA